MNKVICIGYVFDDVKYKEVSPQFTVVDFKVSTSESYKDKKTNEYVKKYEMINCKAYNFKADLISKVVKKSQQISIEGKLKTDSYEKDGVKKYKTYVEVDTFNVLSGLEKKSNNTYKETVQQNDELPFF